MEKIKKVMIYRCGSVPMPLFDVLVQSLYSFFHELFSPGEICPIIEIREIADPIIENLNSEEGIKAFTQLSRTLDPNPVRILITTLPLWDANPSPLMLFALNVLPGTGVYSTFRFTVTNYALMEKRLSKEMVKVFGMAIDMSRCQVTDCIMGFHNIPEDLDPKTGMCLNCQLKCKELIERMFTQRYNF